MSSRLPPIDASIRHEPIGSRELGGLIAIRGFYYQWLYAVRLFKSVLDESHDGFRCEDIDDYLAWKVDRTSQTISKLQVSQVKIRSTGECVLKDEGIVRGVLENFLRHCDGRLSRCPGAETHFNLVYNPSHDCVAEGCVAAFEQHTAYLNLLDRITQIGLSPHSTVRCEPFLALPLTKSALLSELAFLEQSSPQLLEFLTRSENVEAVIKSLIGLIAPFHDLRRAEGDPERLGLDRLIFDKTTTRDALHVAISNAVTRASERAQRKTIEDGISRAIEAADHEFRIAKLDRNAEPLDGHITQGFDDAVALNRALTKIHLLKSAKHPSFWNSSPFRTTRTEHSYRLSQKIDNLISLRKFLDLEPSHNKRIELILSLVHTLADWASVGVYLEDFRSEEAEFQELYLVDPALHPALRLADLDAIRIDEPQLDGLLSAEWVRGSALGKAIQQIYYGSSVRSLIEASALYRASWNDNVVDELAKRLEGALPRADQLKVEIDLLFSAEICRLPIVVGEFDGQFIRDCVNSDVIPPTNALLGVEPGRLLCDRSTGQSRVYFASSEKFQVGLLERSGLPPTIHRFVRYDTRRWASARERDHQMGIVAPKVPPNSLVFVKVSSEQDARSVVEQVFDWQYDDYSRWLSNWLRLARENSVQIELPPILSQELSWIDAQYAQLDRLSGVSFPYRVRKRTSGSNQEVLMIAPGAALINHLVALGYVGPGRRKFDVQLNVKGTGVNQHTFRRASEAVELSKAEVGLTVLTDGAVDKIPERGTIVFSDDGADGVLRADAAPLRILKASFAAPASSSAAPALAWNFLEPLVGSEPVRRRYSPVLDVAHDSASVAFQTTTRGASGTSDLYRNTLDLQSGVSCAVITGAAGTGKTALVADLCAQFLERHFDRRGCPPVRVFVVAATHYALDNFTRAFRRRTNDRYVPYRPMRPRTGLNQKNLDREIHEWSRRHYEGLVADLREGNIVPPKESGLAAVLERTTRQLEATLVGGVGDALPALIPSHANWRARVLGKNAPLCEAERRLLRDVLKQRLADLAELKDHSKAISMVSAQQIDPYATFAAPIVVTTLDGLTQLPDVNCDLVIFEEASQLRLVKLFKVITKFIRARADASPPKIVLSGDPRQLPPFVESISESDTQQSKSSVLKLRKEIFDSETPFEAIARRHPSLVTVLSNQHRMHPSIAGFVRELFYSDQSWFLTRRGDEDRVFWHDTSRSPNSRAKQEDSSQYNDAEIHAIAQLASAKDEDAANLLVISPYASQVARLAHAVGNLANIQTIDGCQGRQAHSVFVSPVSLRFPTKSDFVVDPRRMNVALSRASDYLHIVGNLSELIASVSGRERDYPHMAALARMFGPDGRLRHCVHAVSAA